MLALTRHAVLSTAISLAALALGVSCAREVSQARWVFAIHSLSGPSGSPAAAAQPLDPALLLGAVSRCLPQSIRDRASVRIQGEKLVIEAPLAIERPREPIDAPLGAALDTADAELSIGSLSSSSESVLGSSALEVFGDYPARFGLVRIDDELIAYRERRRSTLLGLTRGAFGTPPASHVRGAKISLVAEPRLARLLSGGGKLRFLVGADCEHLEDKADLDREAQRRDTWLAAHPDASLAAYNALSNDAGGPPTGMTWFVQRADGAARDTQRLVLLRRPTERFGEDDLASVELSQDSLDRPALRLTLARNRKDDFGTFTARIVGCSLGILIDDEILTLANVRSKLQGDFIVEGGVRGFTREDVDDMKARLEAPDLPMALELVEREPAR